MGPRPAAHRSVPTRSYRPVDVPGSIRPGVCDGRSGEEIIVGNAKRFRVIDVVPFDDESPLVGMLEVEAA